MRPALLAPLAALLGCATTSTEYDVRTPVVRDVQGYAIAACLSRQSEPLLKDQGDGYASAIIQRGEGNVDAFAEIAEAVKGELAKGHMAVIRVESTDAAADKPLPVMYCSELIDAPAVRAAIQKAVVTLAADYSE